MQRECFEIPSVHNFKSPTCSGCNDFESCRTGCYTKLCEKANKSQFKTLIAKYESETPGIALHSIKPTSPTPTHTEDKQIDSEAIATPFQGNQSNQTDLKKFMFKMSMDFCRFNLKTNEPTNLKGIRSKLKTALCVESPSFTPLNEQAGGIASEFNVAIQNPKNPAELQAVKDRLAKCGIGSSIDAMEISFDAYPRKGTTLDDLAWQVVRYLKYMSHRFDKKYIPRAYHAKHGQAVPTHPEALHRLILDGWCIAIGNQRDDDKRGTKATPISFRFYLKTTDQGGKVKLKPHECRARMEVTLQGEAFPFTQPEYLNGFDFNRWNTEHGFFNFRCLKEDLKPIERQIALSRIIPGHYATDQTKTRNKNHRHTQADSALNERVRKAAGAFTKQWAKSPACRNSVNFEGMTSITTGMNSGLTDNSTSLEEHGSYNDASTPLTVTTRFNQDANNGQDEGEARAADVKGNSSSSTTDSVSSSASCVRFLPASRTSKKFQCCIIASIKPTSSEFSLALFKPP